MAEKVSRSSLKNGVPGMGFLSGGGEMGKLIREFDWANSPLGPINTWPQSLRTTLSIILKSKFPMVLLWGEKYIFFYNDAYRPTLGKDNKHPNVLGKPGHLVWPESWGSVKPFLDKVFIEGESITFEDQLIPIYRNGQNEDVYWTFSYSPVSDESDSTAGIFITCLETTEKVKKIKSFEENSRTLNLALEIAELGIFNVNLINNSAVYSQQIVEFLGLEQQNLPLSEIFEKIYPEDKEFVINTIEKSISGENAGKHDITYRAITPASGALKYLRSIGQVVFSEGKAISISGIIQDVSQQVLSKKILEDREKAFRNLVMQAPIAIAVFRGTEFIADIVNDAYLSMVGKSREKFVGKPLFKALPEAKEVLEPIALKLIRSGKPVSESELELKLNRGGKEEVIWLNSKWELYYDNDGNVDGFMSVVHEVTGQVLSRRKIEESEARFRSLIAAAPVAIGLFIGRDLIIENPNQAFIDIVGKGDSIIGKPLREAMPELITEGQPFLQILDDVYTSGKMFQTFGTQVKIVRDGVLNYDYYDFTYTPLFDADGKVYAILDIAIDVTEQVHDRKEIEESEQRYRTLIEEASVATGLYMGRELQIRYANDIMLGYWGKDRSVLGMPLSEAVPELQGQPFLQNLDKVFTTGETYEGIEEPAELLIEGKLQVFYFTYTYKALRDNVGKIYGIHHIAIDVTGEVLAKKAVIENEEQLRIAVEGGELGTYNYFPQTGEIVWSAKTKEFFGLPPDASVDYDVFISGIHPDDREKVVAYLQEAMLPNGKPFYENEYRTVGITDGKVRWIRRKGKVIFDDDLKPIRITGIIQDITERKIAEEALQESKDRFQAAVEAIEGTLWTNNAKGEMEGEQSGWAAITGQSYDEYQGYGWANAVHPDDAQATIDAWQEALRKRTTFVFEHRLLLKNKSWGYFSIRAIPLLNSDGSVREWVGVHTNITEQKLASLALKESEARFRSLADQSPMFVYIVEPDAEATMSYFNKTWLEYTGQTFEQAIGTAWNGIVHPDDVQIVHDTYVSAYLNHASYTIPAIRLRRHDGAYRWHMFKGNPRHLSNGEFIGYVGVGIDIHEQKLALDQLEFSNTQLKRINNDLDNFIYTASHDLKAPMSNIEGLIIALRNSFESKTEAISKGTEILLGMMEQSINRFKATILDLTEISKAQRTQDEDINEISLKEIIEDVILSIKAQIDELNAVIEVDITEAEKLKFSRKNIKSIVYNLLSNAIKYSDKVRMPKVTIKTENTQNFIILTVKDNGLGIPRDSLHKVFNMFKRFHDHVEGSGIGLYIVKRIIDNAGGKIEVESEIGRGTTFNVYFPKAHLAPVEPLQ